MTLTLHCELYRAQFSRDRICYLFNSDLASPYLLRTLLQLMCIEEYVCRIWKNTLSWVAALLLPPPSPCSNIYLQLLLHSLDDTSSCCHYVCPLLPSPALMTRVYLLLCLFYFHSGRFRVLLFFAATKTASFPPPQQRLHVWTLCLSILFSALLLIQFTLIQMPRDGEPSTWFCNLSDLRSECFKSSALSSLSSSLIAGKLKKTAAH